MVFLDFLEHLDKEFAHSKEAFLYSINKLPDAESIVININMEVLSHNTGFLNIRSFKNFIKDVAEIVNSNSKRRIVIVVSNSLEETKSQYIESDNYSSNVSVVSSYYSALISLVHNDIVNLFYDGFLNYNLRAIGFSVSSMEADITGELNKKLRTIKGIIASQNKTDEIKLKAIDDLLNSKNSDSRSTSFKAKKTAETIKQLFKNFPRVIPIIMEDFSQKESINEDDDGFAAKIAIAVNADVVVSISGKGRLYTVDPNKSTKALPFYCYDTGRSTPFKNETRRSELSTKLNAAKNINARNKSIPMILTAYNIPYTLRNLFDINSIDNICKKGEYPTFTIFINSKNIDLPIEKQSVLGSVVIDKKAAGELRNTSCNLLSVGIINVFGTFEAKSLVSILDENHIEIGRGISKLNSNDIKQNIKKKGETVITRQKMYLKIVNKDNK